MQTVKKLAKIPLRLRFFVTISGEVIGA